MKYVLILSAVLLAACGAEEAKPIKVEKKQKEIVTIVLEPGEPTPLNCWTPDIKSQERKCLK